MARQFFKKVTAKLREIGFRQSAADPCLMMQESEAGRVFIAIYVDDCYCVGDTEGINHLCERLQQETDTVEAFSITTEDNTSDYLSCEVVFSDDRKKAWLGQPHLIKNLMSKFWNDVKDMKVYRTPGTPNVILRRVGGDIVKVGDELHAKFRSGVGMLLFLIKHSRPDIANTVRELTKMLDAPTEASVKEMFRCIKYVIDTKDFGLKIHPQMSIGDKWTIEAYSDSDWAGDKDTRLSVSGFIIYLLGVPICWRSKQQRSVALSSSEAEYVALSEAAKEVKFIHQVLASMNIHVQTPIIIKVDNVGAMFMAENTSTSARTRHIDIRYQYVREFIVDGLIKVIFVRTHDNLADDFTKNVNGDTFQRHSVHYVWTKGSM